MEILKEAREARESRLTSEQKYEDEINAFANRTRQDLVGKQPSWMKKKKNDDEKKKDKVTETKPLAADKRGILHLAGKKTNSKPFVLGQPDEESPRVSKQEAAELMKKHEVAELKKHEISKALKKKSKADTAEHTPMVSFQPLKQNCVINSNQDVDNETSKEKEKVGFVQTRTSSSSPNQYNQQLVPNAGLQSDVISYGPAVPDIEKTIAIIDGFVNESDCKDIRQVLSRIGYISNFKCTKTCTNVSILFTL